MAHRAGALCGCRYGAWCHRGRSEMDLPVGAVNAELLLEDFLRWDVEKGRRIATLTDSLNFDYPEDVPEIARMTAWGARVFRTSRAELLSQYATEVAAVLDLADVASCVKNYWVCSDLRLTLARGHQEQRAREEGWGNLWDPKTGDVLSPEGAGTRTMTH